MLFQFVAISAKVLSVGLPLDTPPLLDTPPPEFLPKKFREFWKFRHIFEDAIKKIRIWPNLYGTPYAFSNFEIYWKNHMVPPMIFSRISIIFQNSYGTPYEFLKILKKTYGTPYTFL